MINMKALKILIILLMISQSVVAQSSKDVRRLRTKRLRMIEIHHIGMGLDFDSNDNHYLSPYVYYGIGSYRNIINMDVGFRYKVSNPFKLSQDESISVKNLSSFFSVDFNIIRWNLGSAYVGAEVSYCLPITANHRLSASDIVVYDKNIGRNHWHTRVVLGAKFSKWDINVHYDCNLAPMIDQKYIYESLDYDYDKLVGNLYERYRLGVEISYLIPF